MLLFISWQRVFCTIFSKVLSAFIYIPSYPIVCDAHVSEAQQCKNINWSIFYLDNSFNTRNTWMKQTNVYFRPVRSCTLYDRLKYFNDVRMLRMCLENEYPTQCGIECNGLAVWSNGIRPCFSSSRKSRLNWTINALIVMKMIKYTNGARVTYLKVSLPINVMMMEWASQRTNGTGWHNVHWYW